MFGDLSTYPARRTLDVDHDVDAFFQLDEFPLNRKLQDPELWR